MHHRIHSPSVWAGGLAAVLVLSSCASGGAGGAPAMEALTFAPSLAVDLDRMTRTPSGLYYQDLRLGQGREAGAGAQVEVHYAGWLPDGTLVDSHVPPAEPLGFIVSAGEVIRGWDEGVLGMRPGGSRKLVVPPNLAYGSRGVPGAIPRNATLVFQIELVAVGAELRISSANPARRGSEGANPASGTIPLIANPSRALGRPPI
jgi:FKBP-type peptidyl-prolyl cis-trans isomerase FkpA